MEGLRRESGEHRHGTGSGGSGLACPKASGRRLQFAVFPAYTRRAQETQWPTGFNSAVGWFGSECVIELRPKSA